MKNFSFLILMMAMALSSLAERQPLERYQSVVERQMFGPPPDGFDPTKRPSEVASSRDARKQDQELTKEQEKLKSSIRFSMINMTPSGETAVGFTDSSDSKNVRNYYLKVNETSNDRKWTVKSADPVTGSMTIASAEGVEVSLTIGGDSGKGAGRTAAANAGGRATARPQQPSGNGLGSLRARRNQMRAAENARMEALSKQLQEREAAFERRQQEEQRAREEREARQAEEKAQQEAQREEQRKQLLQIQEELKRSREEKERREAETSGSATDKEEE